jgi:hypothetical protein
VSRGPRQRHDRRVNRTQSAQLPLLSHTKIGAKQGLKQCHQLLRGDHFWTGATKPDQFFTKRVLWQMMDVFPPRRQMRRLSGAETHAQWRNPCYLQDLRRFERYIGSHRMPKERKSARSPGQDCKSQLLTDVDRTVQRRLANV